ncbi:hypothetical protein ACFXKR_18410 [Streptomyces violascens]|uniref:hypothetical protein n=1 Tax=Streptomyces violascens TaxID=67381 RepID=UPI0036C3FF89
MSWMFPPARSQRDAIELTGCDVEALPKPSTVTVYRTCKEPLVQLHVDGEPRRAAALERHDVGGRALLGLWPRRRGHDALRTGWFWADTDTMTITALDQHPVEAAELPGDAVRLGRQPRGGTWTDNETLPYGPQGPALVQVRLGGQWHDALAVSRVRFLPAGEEAVRVRIRLATDGLTMNYPRTYWDSPAIQPDGLA